MQRDIEKVEEAYAAWHKRRWADLLLVMAPDIEVRQSPELPWGGHYLGHDGVRKYLEAVAGQVDARIEIERLIDAGEHVVAVGQMKGKTRGTQLEFEVPVVHVWTFSDGQATNLECYTDDATVLAAVGA